MPRRELYDSESATSFKMDDTKSTAFFSRQLEVIAAKTYDRRYPNLKAKQFIPMNNSIDPGATTYKAVSYNNVGMAKFVSAYADDLPRSDIQANEINVTFKITGGSYGYNYEEIRNAQYANVDLSDKKASSTRRSMAALHDLALGTGNSTVGIYGLASQPNATMYTIPNGASTSPTWALKTSKEIFADAVGIVEYVRSTTNQIESPNVLLLPPAQKLIFDTTQMNTGSDLTIADWFKRAKPGVMVEEWDKLATAGGSSTARIVAYVMDSDHLEGFEPIEFLQHEPEPRGLETVVACEGKIGGVVLYYPMSMAYGDGV